MNGRRTCTVPLIPAATQWSILQGQYQVRIGSVGVAPGSTTGGSCVQLSVPTYSQVHAPTTSAFASRSNKLRLHLATLTLAIAENQPIGTIVGEFNATDPDANSTLTYYLVSGAGDTHNSLFTLETNGTLRTATIFDYESNASTYTIRLQAKDEYNATVEGNFTVSYWMNPILFVLEVLMAMGPLLRKLLQIKKRLDFCLL